MSPEVAELLGQLHAKLGPPLPPPGWMDTCPCGHVRDENCVRHRPLGEPANWGSYDVQDLGLVPHVRENCGPCRAVGR